MVACTASLQSMADNSPVIPLVSRGGYRISGLKRRGVPWGPLVLFSGTGTRPPHSTPLAGTDRQTLRQNMILGATSSGRETVQILVVVSVISTLREMAVTGFGTSA